MPRIVVNQILYYNIKFLKEFNEKKLRYKILGTIIIHFVNYYQKHGVGTRFLQKCTRIILLFLILRRSLIRIFPFWLLSFLIMTEQNIKNFLKNELPDFVTGTVQYIYTSISVYINFYIYTRCIYCKFITQAISTSTILLTPFPLTRDCDWLAALPQKLYIAFNRTIKYRIQVDTYPYRFISINLFIKKCM